MRVLGIDPGTTITGYGLVDFDELRLVDCGAIVTPVGMTLPQRLLIIHRRLGGLMLQHQPQAVAVEDSSSARTSAPR